MMESMRSVRAVGGPAKVREGILGFLERTRADELIIAGSIYDPELRCRSLELTMAAMRQS